MSAGATRRPGPGGAVLRAARRLWAAWTRIARRIGDVQARLLLGAFYVVVLGPFALVVRLSADPLRRRGRPAWLPRAPAAADPLGGARRQF